MTFQYLLDTSVVSSPISRTPNPDIVRGIEIHETECVIAAPVWHELTFGCQRLPRSKRRNALEAYLYEVVQASFPILPYDESAAAWHGLERARLQSLGRTVPYADGQIAAIAQVNALTLVTINIKDFIHFKGLKVEDWSRRRPS